MVSLFFYTTGVWLPVLNKLQSFFKSLWPGVQGNSPLNLNHRRTCVEERIELAKELYPLIRPFQAGRQTNWPVWTRWSWHCSRFIFNYTLCRHVGDCIIQRLNKQLWVQCMFKWEIITWMSLNFLLLGQSL